MKNEIGFAAKERRERLVSEWGFFFHKLYIYIYMYIQVRVARAQPELHKRVLKPA